MVETALYKDIFGNKTVWLMASVRRFLPQFTTTDVSEYSCDYAAMPLREHALTKHMV
jgi:hypothetical protein